MIYETVTVAVRAGEEDGFEHAFAEAAHLFTQAEGCRGLALEKVVEHPSTYLIRVQWARLDDHLVTFRGSPAFAAWRETVGVFYRSPPQIVHTLPVMAQQSGPRA